MVKRAKEIRSELILRVFAIERFIRFLLFGGVAFAIWQFGHSKQTIQQAFNSDLPIIRSTFNQLGFNIDHSKLLIEFRKALHYSQGTLHADRGRGRAVRDRRTDRGRGPVAVQALGRVLRDDRDLARASL